MTMLGGSAPVTITAAYNLGVFPVGTGGNIVGASQNSCLAASYYDAFFSGNTNAVGGSSVDSLCAGGVLDMFFQDRWLTENNATGWGVGNNISANKYWKTLGCYSCGVGLLAIYLALYWE